MTIKLYRHRVIILVMLSLLVSLAVAVEPVPLPAFQLTAGDGTTVKSADLPSKGNWVLIYVQPKSQFSDSLLKALKREQYPNLEQHAVIIVGGNVDDLKSIQSKYTDLTQATWYADADKSAYTQLKLHGAPVVLGIKQQIIQWSLNGVLPDTNVSRSVLNSWINP
ncbi:MAG TPA: redoxin domain-containing protein [Candidatus Angelobacter sp.]